MRFSPLLLASLLPSIAAAQNAEVQVDVQVDVQVNVNTTPPPPPPPPPPEIEEPPPPRALLHGTRWELGVGVQGGRFALDDVIGGQIGVRLDLARQVGPFRVAVEYGHSKFSATRDLYDSMGWWNGWEDLGGEVQRYGATLRYRAAAQLPSSPGSATSINGGAGAYVELGAGRQHINWSGGGELRRNDLALGLGLELVGGGRARMGGLDLGVRLIASPSVERAVACAGVCANASSDRTHDVGIVASLGGVFGF